MRLCDLDFLYKGKCIFFKRQFTARTSGETNFSVRIKLKGKIPVMVFNCLTLYTVTSVCKFSLLFSIHDKENLIDN